jgi:hypothetical protein
MSSNNNLSGTPENSCSVSEESGNPNTGKVEAQEWTTLAVFLGNAE